MKRIFIAVLCGLLFSCAYAGEELPSGVFPARVPGHLISTPKPDYITQADIVTVSKMPEKEWTIMVYSNGKNNLSEFCRGDVCEILRAGSDKTRHIVVESGAEFRNVDDSRTYDIRRFYLTEKSASVPFGVIRQVGAPSANADMSDWRQVVNFAVFSRRYFPSNKSMLIMAGHGTGWLKGVSQDDQYGEKYMGPKAIRSLIKRLTAEQARTAPVSVLVYDACFMADIAILTELAYSKSDLYVVASEEFEPATGYNYTRILNKLSDQPFMSSREAAEAVVRAYGESYDSGVGVTAAAIDISQVKPLLTQIRNFVKLALASRDKQVIAEAYRHAHHFGYVPGTSYAVPEFRHAVDMYDFMDLLSSSPSLSDRKLRASAEAIKLFISNRLVLPTRVAYGMHAGKAHGVSCYMPQESYSKGYTNLTFTKATDWDSFVRMVLRQPPARQ